MQIDKQDFPREIFEQGLLTVMGQSIGNETYGTNKWYFQNLLHPQGYRDHLLQLLELPAWYPLILQSVKPATWLIRLGKNEATTKDDQNSRKPCS